MKVLLLTVNSRYAHCSHALRVLRAALEGAGGNCDTLEFAEGARPRDVAEAVLARGPALVGFSTYLWNVQVLGEAAGLLRQLGFPGLLVFGGPEVSDPADLPAAVAANADVVICGEGEEALVELVAELSKPRTAPLPLSQPRTPPSGLSKPRTERSAVSGSSPRLILPPPTDLTHATLPYHLYSDDDLAHRTVYVESSRGCGGTCAFCTAAGSPVRRFPLDRLLPALESLLDRGLRQFKFLDRDLRAAPWKQLLPFFLAQHQAGRATFLHFELTPGAVPQGLVDLLAAFPTASIQLEVGVQTLNPEVLARIGRRQSTDAVLTDLGRLLALPSLYVHADLMAGLPGESLESLAAGFNQLWATGVHEIQLVDVKRLRGTALARFDQEFAQIWSPSPPYELLANRDLDFATLQRLRRLARLLDRLHNNGHFPAFSRLFLATPQPFQRLWAFLLFLEAREAAAGHNLTLDRLTAQHLAAPLLDFALDHLHLDPKTTAQALNQDLGTTRGRATPPRLKTPKPPRQSRRQGPHSNS